MEKVTLSSAYIGMRVTPSDEFHWEVDGEPQAEPGTWGTIVKIGNGDYQWADVQWDTGGRWNRWNYQIGNDGAHDLLGESEFERNVREANESSND